MALLAGEDAIAGHKNVLQRTLNEFVVAASCDVGWGNWHATSNHELVGDVLRDLFVRYRSAIAFRLAGDMSFEDFYEIYVEDGRAYAYAGGVIELIAEEHNIPMETGFGGELDEFLLANLVHRDDPGFLDCSELATDTKLPEIPSLSQANTWLRGLRRELCLAHDRRLANGLLYSNDSHAFHLVYSDDNGRQGGFTKPDDTLKKVVKPKRSTARGDAQVKLVAALTCHHKYADGGCLKLEPIGSNELARKAEVSESSASDFLKKHFDDHAGYKVACQGETKLIARLKSLNNYYSQHSRYGSEPPGESSRFEVE